MIFRRKKKKDEGFERRLAEYRLSQQEKLKQKTYHFQFPPKEKS